MLRSTFENSWRHPVTGEQYGIHAGVQNWLSRLGLKDDQGIALADPEFFNRYGPQGVKDNPQVTLVSNTGHHGQDQAALYLAQQGIQNGKTWYPEMGEVMPPEYAQQAHIDLRDQMEGKKKTADLRDPVTEPSWMATDADIQEMNLCPKCGKPDCIHMVNQSPQGMQIHPKWQDNSTPLDSHGA